MNQVDPESAAQAVLNGFRSAGPAEQPPQWQLHTRTAQAQKKKKGEDFVIVHEQQLQGSTSSKRSANHAHYSVFGVADGHNGPEAAELCQRTLFNELQLRMPSGAAPPVHSLEGQKWAQAVRKALADAFLALDAAAARNHEDAGCTLTVAIVTDRLLTVANVGDSKALLDTGFELMEGVGPLRTWPLGLCMSRAIGDPGAGPGVLAHPHIKQVLVPEAGARLILATDGLWDALSAARIAKLGRSADTSAAVEAIMAATVRCQGGFIADDVSICVVDMLPSHTSSFAAMCRTLKRSRSAEVMSYAHSSGSLRLQKSGSFRGLGCFRAPSAVLDDELPTTSWLPQIEVIADEDSYAAADDTAKPDTIQAAASGGLFNEDERSASDLAAFAPHTRVLQAYELVPVIGDTAHGTNAAGRLLAEWRSLNVSQQQASDTALATIEEPARGQSLERGPC
ncbi:hypothetical protein WJX72_008988 [[Myrmecia] bisecta]|uniref:PPM-type phosphatase domain-containing protein n=1 Tax=[Myrmecia] bisecta TaxID=41462 RepID=A0AAW1R8L2_9CHLO